MLTTSSEQREGGLVSHRRVWGPAQAVRANRTKPCVTPAIVRWKAPSIIGKAPPFAGRMWERWPWSVSNVARALQALAASLGRRSAHAPQGCPGGNEEGHPRHTGPSLEPHGPQLSCESARRCGSAAAPRSSLERGLRGSWLRPARRDEPRSNGMGVLRHPPSGRVPFRKGDDPSRGATAGRVVLQKSVGGVGPMSRYGRPH